MRVCPQESTRDGCSTTPLSDSRPSHASVPSSPASPRLVGYPRQTSGTITGATKEYSQERERNLGNERDHRGHDLYRSHVCARVTAQTTHAAQLPHMTHDVTSVRGQFLFPFRALLLRWNPYGRDLRPRNRLSLTRKAIYGEPLCITTGRADAAESTDGSQQRDEILFKRYRTSVSQALPRPRDRGNVHHSSEQS